jgi:hypothetical protein
LMKCMHYKPGMTGTVCRDGLRVLKQMGECLENGNLDTSALPGLMAFEVGHEPDKRTIHFELKKAVLPDSDGKQVEGYLTFDQTGLRDREFLFVPTKDGVKVYVDYVGLEQYEYVGEYK